MDTTSTPTPVAGPAAPAFLANLDLAHQCGKSVQMLTGDVQGLFWSQQGKKYVPLEQLLSAELAERFTIICLDMVGISFYTNQALKELLAVCRMAKIPIVKSAKDRQSRSIDNLGAELEALLNRSGKNGSESQDEVVLKRIADTKYAPLTAMALLQDFFAVYAEVRESGEKIKPLCVVIRHAETLFPQKEAAYLDQQDRQRLVFFLNWISDLKFLQSEERFILLSQMLAEVNKNITSASNSYTARISLPLEKDRLDFSRFYLASAAHNGLLAISVEELARATASLTLGNIQALFKTAEITGNPVDQAGVNKALDEHLEELFGQTKEGVPLAELDHGGHTAADVDFYDREKSFLENAFKRSKNPKTAISVIGVFGPNGGGKTYITEGVVRSSGWRILRLKGLRSSDFGGTERLFETLMLVLEPFDLVAIVIDEADTDLGDVRNNPQSHEVERRLYGKFVAVMSDKRYLGKIIWVLMTIRPDKLGADIRSRCLVKVPIFDLTGDERKKFIRKQLERRSLVLSDEEFEVLFSKSLNYSNRDLDGMLTLFAGERQDKPDLTLGQFMEIWQADEAIADERKFQMLIAAQNCTYPALLPEWIKAKTPQQRAEEIENLKFQLGIQ